MKFISEVKLTKYEWKRCTKTIADQLRFLP